MSRFPVPDLDAPIQHRALLTSFIATPVGWLDPVDIRGSCVDSVKSASVRKILLV
jgi:hypothetical protein